MTIVWADDITGAAEIAGISLRYGLNTALLTSLSTEEFAKADTIVIATNIRSASKDDAEKQSLEICRIIDEYIKSQADNAETQLFIKTDSVLRGHINTELSAAMSTLNRNSSLLIAQNPSKGRIIKSSTYYINGTKLEDTLFNKDPEFPAISSSPAAIVGGNCTILPVEEDIRDGRNTIFIGEAATTDDIKNQMSKAEGGMILAGGADFFEAYLLQNVLPHHTPETACQHTDITELASDCSLVVSGSTQGKSILDTPLMKRLHAKEISIPDDVFEGADPSSWIADSCTMFSSSLAMIMRIGEHEFKGVEYAQRLKRVMALATEALIRTKKTSLLIIEGGATAFAILEQLKWNKFSMTHEFAPGVVAMRHCETTVILKPGSYSWGELFN